MAIVSSENGIQHIGLQSTAAEVIRKLVSSLLAWRNEQFLFNSNIDGDKAPSITVSAISAFALHETKRREAQQTCSAILDARWRTEPSKGAWKAQGGDYFHTFGTAWAILGCLRVRPTCVAELADSVAWLIDQRPDGQTGWGHTKQHSARAFETAYVLNALMEFRECWDLFGINQSALLISINNAIEGGVAFLLEALNPKDQSLFIWDRDPKNPGICLATTAISIHVLTKYRRNSGKSVLLRGLNRALECLCPYITRESVNSIRLSVQLNHKSFDVDLWPSFNSNSPSYWNRYFTPILAVTFLDFYSDADEELRRHLRSAIVTFVEWIINNTKASKDGRTGVRGDTGSTPYVWSTAQGIIILRRWLDALEIYPDLGSPTSQPMPANAPATRTVTPVSLAQVFARYYDKPGLQKLLYSVPSLKSSKLVVDNGTPEEICVEMFKRLENNPQATLEVLIEAEKEKKDKEDLKNLRKKFIYENFYAYNH